MGWLCFLLAALVGTSVSVPKLHLGLLLHLPLGYWADTSAWCVSLWCGCYPSAWALGAYLWELDLILPFCFLARLLARIQAAR